MAKPLRKTQQFFMLTPNVRDKLLDANLTAAEWRVWCYLVSLDPFGDRGAKFSPAELMLRCGIKKSTYFATKAKFQKLGLFDFKDGTTKVYNLQSHPVDTEESDHSQQQQVIESKILESESKILESESKILESESKILESESKILESESKILENQRPKAAFSKDSSTPQTNQTYTDFIQTLSEEERENFEKFVRDEWRRRKGEEIISLERFLAKEEDFKNWRQRFLDAPAGRSAKKRAIATSYNWRNDARFDTWIWEAFNRGFEWLQEDEGEREQRRAFYDWAFAVNAFDGVCL
ncbi:hypothetical protein [Chroococcidiopsis sp. TS-821]|uniref:hypothetical protein n=1 Tax=Chroococcidiopsis sp. TS-821 TaxID=1378066 RepID=UPI000CEDD3D0|nr:hypothetical protein [Chroococcidiopsis sp. TS-821]PPS41937.1 hypothetical protein B1A85_15775 [Chroococcidiopsis sp. TS-821]